MALLSKFVRPIGFNVEEMSSSIGKTGRWHRRERGVMKTSQHGVQTEGSAADRGATLSAERMHEPAQEVRALVELVISRLPRDSREPPEPLPQLPVPSDEEVGTLTAYVIRQDLEAAIDMAERSTERTPSWWTQRLVVEVAKKLGEGWDRDDYTFADVTVGAGTLQRLVGYLEPVIFGTTFRGVVLLTSSLAEQHSLGLFVLARALREDNWAVLVQPRLSVEQLCDLVESEEADAVGLSLSDPDRSQEIESYVGALRAHPRAPHILLGGPAMLASTARRLRVHHCAEPAAACAKLGRLV